jgi:predicted transcriptional regulator
VEHQFRSLTAQIVSAHVANNNVAVDQLAGLIREVYQMLATVEQVPVDPIKAEPAVEVKKSVFADHILCLDCGQSFKMLKRHISTDHQMTPDEYRAKWDLPPTYPMVAAEYAATRSNLAKDSGLGRKGRDSTPFEEEEGRSAEEGLGSKLGETCRTFVPSISWAWRLPATTPTAAPTNPAAAVPASATSNQPDYE